MDGDRPVVDGRNLLESELQGLLLEAWAIGTNDGENDDWSNWQEELYPKLHELLISYPDGPTSDVGAQDETSKEGEMGDGVRSEGYLTLEGLSHDFQQITRDTEIEFAKKMELEFAYRGKEWRLVTVN